MFRNRTYDGLYCSIISAIVGAVADIGVDAGVAAGIAGGIDAGIAGGIDAGIAGGIDAGIAGGIDAGVAGGLDAGVGAFGAGAADLSGTAAGITGAAAGADAASLGAIDASIAADTGALGGAVGADAGAFGAGAADLSGATAGITGADAAAAGPISAGTAAADAAAAPVAGIGSAATATPIGGVGGALDALSGTTGPLSALDTGGSFGSGFGAGGADAFGAGAQDLTGSVAGSQAATDAAASLGPDVGDLGGVSSVGQSVASPDFGGSFSDLASSNAATAASNPGLSAGLQNQAFLQGGDFQPVSDAGLQSGTDVVPQISATDQNLADIQTFQGGNATQLGQAAQANNQFDALGANIGTTPGSVTPVQTSTISTGQIGTADVATGGPSITGLSPSAQTALGTPASGTPDIGISPQASGAIAGPAPAAPATPAATVAPSAGSTAGAAAPAGGITAQLGQVLNSPWTRAATLGVPLAALGVTALRGQPNLPSTAQTAVGNTSALSDLGNQQLTQAASGQLTPSQLAQININVQNQKNQLYQLYSSMGRNPNQDSDFIQASAQIDQQAVAQYQQFINSMISNGLAATGQANQALLSAAQIQVQQDTAFTQSIGSALQSFGLLAGLSARAPVATA